MESGDLETEKFLKYLWSQLNGHSSIDLVVAGIFIAEDYTKMEKVVKLIKNARQLMNQHSVKRDQQIILFEEMIHKLYNIQNGEKPSTNGGVEDKADLNKEKTKKWDKKSKDKMEEETQIKASQKEFENKNGAVVEIKEVENLKEPPKPENDNSKSPVDKEKQSKSNELRNLINMKDEDSNVQSYTIVCSWETLLDYIRHFGQK